MSSPDKTVTERRPRASLTREAIVAAAVEIVEEDGPAALSMRAVADRLGSGVMSLYRHVADREALLDLVLEAMVGDPTPPTLVGDWRADLATVARDVRARLLRRPQLTVLLTSRGGRGRADLPGLESTLGVLRAAGFSPTDAVLVNQALGNYVAGAALWEAVGLAGTTGQEREARRAAVLETVAGLPSDRFPNIAWVGSALVEGSLDERFEFGLARLIEGVAGLSRTPKGRRATTTG